MISNFFCVFFNLLNESGIHYAVAGRTEDYPEKVDGDIDVIIYHNDFDRFWMFMNSLRLSNIKWIQSISHEFTAYFCIISVSEGNRTLILKPDVCSHYYRNGLKILEDKFLLEDRRFVNGFYRLSPSKEFIYYLIKKIEKRKINEFQFNHLCVNWNQETKECSLIIKKHFENSGQEIIKNIFLTNNIELLINNFDSLSRQIHTIHRISVVDFVCLTANRFKRILQPTGLVIAIMGPDGCGKSTIIEGLKNNISDVFRSYKQFHLFPKELTNSIPVTNPHSKPARGFLGSILKLIYFLILYVSGFVAKVYPYKVKSTLVIFDRYYHDLLIDPKRFRHKTNRFWINLIGFFIPKPDLWILLDAPTEVIQNRKSEVPIEETERQRNEYLKLFGQLKNSFIVNANQEPVNVIFDSEQIIVNFLESRTKNRNK